MDRIPSIGGARGLFEIFVPGLFLLLNMVGAMYFLPFADDSTRRQLSAIATAPTLAVLVAVPFGYLAGVVLRLFRTEVPDRASSFCVRLYDRNARGGEMDGNRYAYEPFPYIQWLETVVKRDCPPAACEFFRLVWKGEHRRQFVNFCKVVVAAEDPLAAAEIYSAESLSRYVSGMFYALAGALAILIILALTKLIAGVAVGVAVPVLAGAYAVGAVAILANFRFIRIKEVETVFAATFKNRHLFLFPEQAA